MTPPHPPPHHNPKAEVDGIWHFITYFSNWKSVWMYVCRWRIRYPCTASKPIALSIYMITATVFTYCMLLYWLVFNPNYILTHQDYIYRVRVQFKLNPNFGVLLRLNGETRIQLSEKDDFYNTCFMWRKFRYNPDDWVQFLWSLFFGNGAAKLDLDTGKIWRKPLLKLMPSKNVYCRGIIDQKQTKEPSALSVDGWRVAPWLPVLFSRCKAIDSGQTRVEITVTMQEEHIICVGSINTNQY